MGNLLPRGSTEATSYVDYDNASDSSNQSGSIRDPFMDPTLAYIIPVELIRDQPPPVDTVLTNPLDTAKDAKLPLKKRPVYKPLIALSDPVIDAQPIVSDSPTVVKLDHPPARSIIPAIPVVPEIKSGFLPKEWSICR